MNENFSNKRRHEMMSGHSHRRNSPHISGGPIEDFGSRKRPALQPHSSGRYTPRNNHNFSPRYNHSPPRFFNSDIPSPHKTVITLPYSLLIPNELIGFLIGTGGACIKEIENASSAILYFEKSGHQNKNASSPAFNSDNNNTSTNNSNDNNNENNNQISTENASSEQPNKEEEEEEEEGITDKILSIYGSQNQKNNAVNLILTRIRSIRTLQDSGEKDAIIIGLPMNSLPLLIGSKGSTINRLTHTSGCQILVQNKTPKNEQLKAVSIRSSHISGLVNCISLIYETFEEFIYQGKLHQDDFLLLKDEKSTRFARDACVAATAEAMSRRKFQPSSPPNHPPSTNDQYSYFPSNRDMSPRNHKRMMGNHPESSHRNFSSLPYPNDNPIKQYREDSPYNNNHDNKYNSHFREYSMDPYPTHHHMSRDNDYDSYSNRMDHRNYYDMQDSGRGVNNKVPFRSFNDHRRKDFQDSSMMDNSRYHHNNKEDNPNSMSNGMMHSGHKLSDAPLMNSYDSHVGSYNKSHNNLSPRFGQVDGKINLLNHPFADQVTPFHIKFVVSTDTAAWVVGKRGDHIKEVKRYTGADILVSDQKSKIEGLETDERLLKISGTIHNKYKTFQILISPMLSRSSNSNKPIRMLLPLKSVSFVIGYRGLIINQITYESMAEVNVEKQSLVDGDRPVTISGNPAAQLTAGLLLFEKVEEYYNSNIAAEKLRLPMIPLNFKSPIYTPQNNSYSSNQPSRMEMNMPRDSSPVYFK